MTPQLTPDGPKQDEIDTGSLPPDLAEIIAVWPKLPEPVKAAVKALIRNYPAED